MKCLREKARTLLNLHAFNFKFGHSKSLNYAASMPVLKRYFNASVILLCLLLVPFETEALGLGKLEVRSHLDEPFRAEVELQSLHDQPLQTIKVQLASRGDFNNADIDRTAQLSSLRFVVRQMPSGKPVIQITTLNGVSEPYLHFLISVNWSGGRILREYTALLDPPTYAATAPPTVLEPAKNSEQSQQPAVEISPIAAESSSLSEVKNQVVTTPTSMTATTVPVAESAHQVKKGETAWQIVQSIQQSADVNVYQLLQTLRQTNPEAFINNNVNLLKAGSHLKLPNLDQARAVSKQEASRQYRLQLDLWKAYQDYVSNQPAARDTLAANEKPKIAEPLQGRVNNNSAGQARSTATVGQLPLAAKKPASAAAKDEKTVAEKQSGKASVSPVISGSEKSRAQNQDANSSKDLLKIVQTTVSKSVSTASRKGGNDAVPGSKLASTVNDTSNTIDQLRSRITGMEENLLSRDLENKDLRERVALLEQQVQNAKRLIEIRNQQLAKVQGKQSSASSSNAELVLQNEDVKVTSPVLQQKTIPSDTSMPASSSTSIAEVGPNDTAQTTKIGQATAGSSLQPVTKPVKPAIKLQVKKAQPPVPPADPWWQQIYESVTGNQSSLFGIGGGVVLLGGALLAFLRRRRVAGGEEDDEGSHQIFTGSGKDAVTESGGGDSDSSFLSDFGLSGMGMMQAAEVDPLAEAEVYMAYGRDEQAEEVLREAITRDPSRSEIKLKLLDIYEQRSDVKSFEALAQELSPLHSGYDQNVWSKVVEMGQRLDPDNQLFKIPTVPQHQAAVDSNSSIVEASLTAVKHDSAGLGNDGVDNPFAELDPELGAVEFEAPNTDKLSSLLNSTDEDMSTEGITPPKFDLPDLDLEPKDSGSSVVDTGVAVATAGAGLAASLTVKEDTAFDQKESMQDASDDLSSIDLSDFDLRPDDQILDADSVDLELPSTTDDTLDFELSDLELGMEDSDSPLPSDELVLDAASLEAEQKAAGDDELNLLDFDLTDPVEDINKDFGFTSPGQQEPSSIDTDGAKDDKALFSGSNPLDEAPEHAAVVDFDATAEPQSESVTDEDLSVDLSDIDEYTDYDQATMADVDRGSEELAQRTTGGINTDEDTSLNSPVFDALGDDPDIKADVSTVITDNEQTESAGITGFHEDNFDLSESDLSSEDKHLDASDSDLTDESERNALDDSLPVEEPSQGNSSIGHLDDAENTISEIPHPELESLSLTQGNEAEFDTEDRGIAEIVLPTEDDHGTSNVLKDPVDATDAHVSKTDFSSDTDQQQGFQGQVNAFTDDSDSISNASLSESQDIAGSTASQGAADQDNNPDTGILNTTALPDQLSAALKCADDIEKTEANDDGLDELDQMIAQDFDISDEDEPGDWSFDEPVAATTDNRSGVAEDEAATKLDLARAYIDMGDEEGARGILNEVIEEGNSAQRAQAKSVIGELAS